MKNSVLNVGIVGLQHMHPRFYMSLFNSVKETKVVSVAEGNTNLRKSFCKDFSVKGYRTLDEMLENEQLDMAALFLPHAEFPGDALKCARRKVHLMVDKPMAADAKGGKIILKAAKKHNVKLTTGYYFRLNHAAVEMKRIIKSGKLGKLLGGEGRFLAPGVNRYIEGHSGWMLEKKKSGGGAMQNLGVHWIDMFRFLLEDEAVEASGRNIKINKKYDIEDLCLAQVKFSKGAVVSLNAGYTVPAAFKNTMGNKYFSMVGSKGMLYWGQTETGKNILVASTASDYKVKKFDFNFHYMGREYIRAFADWILEGKKMFVTGEDGLNALKVVDAIYQSAKTNKWTKIKNK